MEQSFKSIYMANYQSNLKRQQMTIYIQIFRYKKELEI